MAAKSVNVKEICRLLAGAGHKPLSEKSISKFVDDGMPKASRGRYDSEACARWYIGRLRTSVKREQREGTDGSTLNLEDERRRLIAAQADNEEMTAAERRTTLVPQPVFDARIAAFTSVTMTAALRIPGRLAGRVETLTRVEAKALMMAAVRDCLMDLARNAHKSQPAAEPVARVRVRKDRVIGKVR